MRTKLFKGAIKQVLIISLILFPCSFKAVAQKLSQEEIEERKRILATYGGLDRDVTIEDFIRVKWNGQLATDNIERAVQMQIAENEARIMNGWRKEMVAEKQANEIRRRMDDFGADMASYAAENNCVISSISWEDVFPDGGKQKSNDSEQRLNMRERLNQSLNSQKSQQIGKSKEKSGEELYKAYMAGAELSKDERKRAAEWKRTQNVSQYSDTNDN